MYVHKGKELHVLQYLRPETGHYMVLESFTNTPHKTMHVIKLERDDGSPAMTFKIGRGNDVDIRITDISVSRNHAEIRLNGGRFFLKDKNAKFGTLVLLRTPLGIGNHSKDTVSL